MAHTPGDWEIRDNEIWVKVNDSRRAIKLAIVVPWPKVTDDNARLIVAAPELLSLLERILKVRDTIPGNSPVEGILDDAESLIAKVRGA